jgi:hypothetical protein
MGFAVLNGRSNGGKGVGESFESEAAGHSASPSSVNKTDMA